MMSRYGYDDDDDDDDLSDLLSSFMTRLRAYLDEGGPENVLDRLLAAGTVAAAAVLILWNPNRKTPGFIGVLKAVGAQLWARRGWFGAPAPRRRRRADD